jgi:hypothetical protein
MRIFPPDIFSSGSYYAQGNGKKEATPKSKDFCCANY